MKKKVLSWVLPVMSFIFLIVAMSFKDQPVQAIQVEEPWGAPTFIYGGGLTNEQIQQTKAILNIGQEPIEEFAVTGEDIYTYLGQSNVPTSAMISSVLVERQGQGVEVKIANPENISKITPDIYENAAITAGVSNVTITVASPQTVTGESALTGVYKALEVNGENLDQDRMIVAQEEIETTADINQHLTTEQSAQLTQIIVNIKQEINNFYQENHTNLSIDNLTQIIQAEIQKANLEDVISQDQINRLVSFFDKYQQTGAIDSEEVQKQLNELGGQLQDIYQEAKDSGLLDRLWQAIVNFFNTILALFQGEGQEG